jgi:hypothetical protein
MPISGLGVLRLVESRSGGTLATVLLRSLCSSRIHLPAPLLSLPLSRGFCPSRFPPRPEARYYGCSDSRLRAALRPVCRHELRPDADAGLPCLSHTTPPAIRSPTTPPARLVRPLPCSVSFETRPLSGAGLRHYPAGSSAGIRRIGFACAIDCRAHLRVLPTPPFSDAVPFGFLSFHGSTVRLLP